VDVGEVHVRGPSKLVSQMSIFCDLHAWTISKSTRGHLFPAGYTSTGSSFKAKQQLAVNCLKYMWHLAMSEKATESFWNVTDCFQPRSKLNEREIVSKSLSDDGPAMQSNLII
jgi:hypothetical protein